LDGGDVAVGDMKREDLPCYEGLDFPKNSTVAFSSQIVKYKNLEPECEVSLLVVDKDQYLEANFLGECYSKDSPLMSFLFTQEGLMLYKFATEFETFHGIVEDDEIPEPTTKLQKECYKFILNQIGNYNLVEVKDHA